MALVRRNPAAEFDLFRRQMDQLLNDLRGDQAWNETVWNPAVELNDAGDNLELKAQIPGIKQDDLDVTVNRDSVTISGEYRHENDGQNSYGSEFHYGKFSRTIGLPVGIQQDKAEADYTDGILTLRLPKVEAQGNRKVKINIGGQSNQAIAGSNG
jgi:HSP20 family protein